MDQTNGGSAATASHGAAEPFRVHADSRNMQVIESGQYHVVIGSARTAARVTIRRMNNQWNVDVHLEWPGIGSTHNIRFFTDLQLRQAFRLGSIEDRDSWSMASAPGRFRRVQDALRIPGDGEPYFLPDGTSDGSANVDVIVRPEIAKVVADLMAANRALPD